MLTVDRVCKRYGDRLVLDAVCATVGSGDHVALIGPNGSGKSTLLRIIVGDESADTGGVTGSFAREGARYLAQGALDAAVFSAADLAPGLGEVWSLGQRASGDGESEADSVLAMLDRFESLGGWQAFADSEAILRGLGIAHLSPDAPADQLSGGERTKLGLAALLYQPGVFLLLDEPTNHLDLEALAWLEEYLRAFSGALLLVSHDRAFIDAVAESVLELDGETHQLRRFAGGYSAYAEQRERERESALDSFRRQQEQVQRIEADIRSVKQRASKFDTASQNDH
ncbi:MAG: ATP-binding cassette domain-containing protein, partial [Dehalococcoidia bacterium]